MIDPCLDKNDTACLLQRLDRESRWAVGTIHKTLVQMRALVEASYPEARRADAYGSWGPEAAAATPEAMFETFCNKRRCMRSIADGFGAVASISDNGKDRVLLRTIRGGTFEMAKYDGQWGLALFQEELKSAKLRFIDSLKQVEKNARAFEEQRRATGSAQ